MELWIRSQDKRNLKKINTEIYIRKIYTRKGLSNYAEGGVYFIASSGTELGEYKTKERALEVLDEIQKYITPTLNLLDDTLKGKQVCQVNNILSMVYEMPKE